MLTENGSINSSRERIFQTIIIKKAKFKRINDVELFFKRSYFIRPSDKLNKKSKRASFDAGPLLTNPLNSCTKLQISAT
jgi:hypothetical protein